MNPLVMLLAFLAGVGLEPLGKTLKGLVGGLGGKGAGGKSPADPNRPHRGGVTVQAGQRPGATAAPSMLKEQGGQLPPDLMQLLALLAQQAGGQEGPQPQPF